MEMRVNYKVGKSVRHIDVESENIEINPIVSYIEVKRKKNKDLFEIISIPKEQVLEILPIKLVDKSNKNKIRNPITGF